MLRLNKRHWTILGPAFLFACRASAPTPQPEAREFAAHEACPKCECQVQAPSSKEGFTEIFAFGSWMAKLGERQGRCLLTLQSFGVQAHVIEQQLDLSAPCYVSRWSSIPGPKFRNPKDTSIPHGGPGDAQVWQFGRNSDSAVFITSIHGFDLALAIPHDRDTEHRQRRCTNASQNIRIKGKGNFSLGEAFSSPKFVSCALQTIDMKAFAVGAQDLFDSRKRSQKIKTR